MQLAAFSLFPAAPSGGLLDQFIGNQARTVVPAAPAVKGGASEFTAAVAESPLTFDPASDPATDRQQVNNADLAATTTAFDLGAILGPLINNPIVGPVVLFGAIAFGFLLILPVEWFVQTVYGAIAGVLGLPPVLPLPGTVTATAEADSTAALIFSRDSVSSDPVLATLATAAPADMAPAAKSGKADVSPPVTSIDKRTRTEQMTSTEPATENVQISTDTETAMTGVAETAEEDEAPTGLTAASAPERSLSASTSKPAKPTLRPATPRPVVRGSLGVGEQLRDLPHRGNGGRPTTRTADAGDGTAAAGPSSVASSPAASRSTAGKSSGGDSSRGDAGDS